VTARIATTQWSQVLAARDGTETEARKALESLCQTYWPPLYAYARSLGHDADKARDLTQGFFAYLVDKEVLQSVEPSAGRFRAFLFAAIRNFISKDRRRERTLKRGGATTTVSLDAIVAERQLSGIPIDEMTPEQVFEYRWGLTVLERALSRLERECSDQGKAELFKSLKAHLTGQEPRVPYREISEEIDMTETAVRGAMYRLRQRYGQLIRLEIGETVADPADVDDELKYLLSVTEPWESR